MIYILLIVLTSLVVPVRLGRDVFFAAVLGGTLIMDNKIINMELTSLTYYTRIYDFWCCTKET